MIVEKELTMRDVREFSLVRKTQLLATVSSGLFYSAEKTEWIYFRRT